MCKTCKDTCNCNQSPTPKWEAGKVYESRSGDTYTFIGLYVEKGIQRAVFHRDNKILYSAFCVRNVDGTHEDRAYYDHDIIHDEPTQEEREWAAKIANALGYCGTTRKLCMGELSEHSSSYAKTRAEKLLKLVREIRDATR
jgi:hypothetical protein